MTLSFSSVGEMLKLSQRTDIVNNRIYYKPKPDKAGNQSNVCSFTQFLVVAKKIGQLQSVQAKDCNCEE